MAKKTTKTDNPLGDLTDAANRIWLAGLGAVATAEEEGEKVFKKLIERGRDLESKGREQVKDQVDRVRSVAESAAEGLSSSFDERLASALHRLGVPTREEIQTLTRRVEELTRKIETLKATPPAKPATPKAATPKAATAKAANSSSTASKTASRRKTSAAKSPATAKAADATGAAKA